MPTTKRPTKRHIVDIVRPLAALDDRGQLDGSTATVAASVYASIEPLNGRELEIARQIMPAATTRVRFFVDSRWALATSDWLVRTDGGPTLNIGHIAYGDQEIEVEANCLCGEQPGPLTLGVAPDPPTALSATPTSPTTVDVAFTPAATGEPAVSFRLHWSTTLGGPYVLVASGAASPLTHDGATDGVDNYYVVTGISISGAESTDSNEVGALTPADFRPDLATIQMSATEPTAEMPTETVTPEAAVVQITATNPTFIIPLASVEPADATIQMSATEPRLLGEEMAPNDAIIQMAAEATALSELQTLNPASATIQIVAESPTLQENQVTIPDAATIQMTAESPNLSITDAIDPADATIQIAATSPVLSTPEPFAPTDATIQMASGSPNINVLSLSAVFSGSGHLVLPTTLELGPSDHYLIAVRIRKS